MESRKSRFATAIGLAAALLSASGPAFCMKGGFAVPVGESPVVVPGGPAGGFVIVPGASQGPGLSGSLEGMTSSLPDLASPDVLNGSPEALAGQAEAAVNVYSRPLQGDANSYVARGMAPSDSELRALEAEIQQVHPEVERFRNEIGKVIVGQKHLVDSLVIALFLGEHVLIESVPGLAKTLAAETLGAATDGKVQIIQFTPDLLPSDITGVSAYDPSTGKFHDEKGPIFANIVVADEINRSPPKVHSALIRAMQNRRVPIGKTDYPLEEVFLVIGTRNPIEQEGTYILPEAVLDRFMFLLRITYPSRQEEREVMNRFSTKNQPTAEPVLTLEQVVKMRSLIDRVYVEPNLQDYIQDIVEATRNPVKYKLVGLKDAIALGASPRAPLMFLRAARARAFLDGRKAVTPEDIKAVAPDILRHRIIPSHQAGELTTDQMIQEILDTLDRWRR